MCIGAEEQACRSVEEIEGRLQSPNLEILGSAPAPEGIQGAHVLTLAATTGGTKTVFRAK
jgi:hypothetical protein